MIREFQNWLQQRSRNKIYHNPSLYFSLSPDILQPHPINHLNSKIEYKIPRKSKKSNKMVKQQPQPQPSCPKNYRQRLNNAQSRLKQTKKAVSHGHGQRSCWVTDDIQYIVGFMGEAKAYLRSGFYRAIVVVDNLWVCGGADVENVDVSENAVKNLFCYFQTVIQQINNPKYQDHIQKIIYACLFLILLLLQKSDKDRPLKHHLYTNILHCQFLPKFPTLPFQTFSKDTIRVISAILAYTIRHPNWSTYQHQLTQTTLALLPLCQEEATRYYLICVLREEGFWEGLEFCGRGKRDLLGFVGDGLGNLGGERDGMGEKRDGEGKGNCKYLFHVVVKLMRNWVLEDQGQGDMVDTVGEDVLGYWNRYVELYPEYCTAALDKILQATSPKSTYRLFLNSLTTLLSPTNPPKQPHLQILQKLHSHLPSTTYLQYLTEYDQLLTNIQKMEDPKLKQFGQKMKENLKEKLAELDPNFLRIYQNFKMGEVVLELVGLY